MSLRDQDLSNVQKQLAKVRAYWARQEATYPFEVEVPLDKPILPLFETKYGFHRSAVLRAGTRTFGFQQKQDAEDFMRDHPNATGKFFMSALRVPIPVN